MRRTTGALLVALSGISFGSLSVFMRHLKAAGVSVPMMLSVRFLGGALVLWALAFARGEVRRLRPGQWLGFAVLGVLYVVEAWIYFESAMRIPVALTALLLYLYPSIVAVISRLAFKERLGAVGVVALVLASSGVALAVGTPSGPLEPLGVVLGAMTAFIYSAYVLLGARVQPGVPSTLGSATLMTIAGLLLLLGTFATGTWSPGIVAQKWPDMLGLIVLGTAIPIPFLLAGLAIVGPTRGSIISSLEPISAAVLGAVFLGESLGPGQLVGGALVLGALVLLSLRREAQHPA
jgi:drug/metabolite transporter (DMT)-like permease